MGSHSEQCYGDAPGSLRGCAPRHCWFWRRRGLVIVMVVAAFGSLFWPSDLREQAMSGGALGDGELDTARSATALGRLEDGLTGLNPYLYRETDARADPVNLIFQTADSARVADAVQQVLGWQRVTGTAMTFRDRGQPHATAYHFVQMLDPNTRLHLRIEAVTVANAQAYVLAAVHRDETGPCGHVGRAFVETRDLVAHAFAAAGYHVQRVFIDNAAPGAHCDGSITPSDGHAALIVLPVAE